MGTFLICTRRGLLHAGRLAGRATNRVDLLSIGIYYNPTASPSTIVLSVSMHLPVSIASQELAQID